MRISANWCTIMEIYWFSSIDSDPIIKEDSRSGMCYSPFRPATQPGQAARDRRPYHIPQRPLGSVGLTSIWWRQRDENAWAGGCLLLMYELQWSQYKYEGCDWIRRDLPTLAKYPFAVSSRRQVGSSIRFSLCHSLTKRLEPDRSMSSSRTFTHRRGYKYIPPTIKRIRAPGYAEIRVIGRVAMVRDV